MNANLSIGRVIGRFAVAAVLLASCESAWGASKQTPAQQVQSIGERDERVNELFAQAGHLLKINRAYEARAPLEQAMALEPSSPGIRCNLGLAYQNSGNLPKAIEQFKVALELSPHMPEATLNLAGCYQSLGDNATAIRWYTTYLKENPHEPQAKQVADVVQALKETLQDVSDPKKADYLANVTAEGKWRWAAAKMPIRVYIESFEDPKSGFRMQFLTALTHAFDEWCRASQGKVKYVVVHDKGNADIYCSWTSNPAEVADSGTQSERGSAQIVLKGANIQRARLKILTRPLLEDGVLSDDEILKACLHEVGHVLGLQGHSTNNHDVMFYTVDTATVWPVLSKRDKATIAKLYE